jgi:hypothetical protein
MALKLTDGRDELNLAEFPLCALARRVRPDQKTLHFADRVWDEGRQEEIDRQLTITASEAYGLPTALDDEVLLGLIQLTKLNGFAARQVRFSRYQLIRLLDWRDETKSYERIEASLNRWLGVSLFYRNAWWNKSRQCWVDEKFHILDNVRLCHRSAGVSRAGASAADGFESMFTWNEVLFRSFQAGNLKSVDFEFFKRLDSVIAKRLYRFLDKRFFHRRQWEFDLRELAWEHVGLARSCDAASLKRKLSPGIAELERKGYLEPRPLAERFRKRSAGQWRVVFDQAASPASPERTSVPPGAARLVAALTARGITPRRASEIVRTCQPERITTQMAVFDWMVGRRDPKISRNPPGFLLAAIRGDYAPPREFLSHQASSRQAQQTTERKRQTQARQQQHAAREQAQQQARHQQIAAFWAALSPSQQRQLEAEALAQATPFQRRLIARGGSSGAAARKLALDALAVQRLAAQARHATYHSPAD